MSNGNAIPNLDRLAAEHAQAIISCTRRERGADAKDVDNTITKALGVLQEDGVYACFLYLYAKEVDKKEVDKKKEEKDNGSVVIEEMLNLLGELPGFEHTKPLENIEQVLGYITNKVTVDLERLLLAKETLEQMLIYARYGAKARS